MFKSIYSYRGHNVLLIHEYYIIYMFNILLSMLLHWYNFFAKSKLTLKILDRLDIFLKTLVKQHCIYNIGNVSSFFSFFFLFFLNIYIKNQRLFSTWTIEYKSANNSFIITFGIINNALNVCIHCNKFKITQYNLHIFYAEQQYSDPL